MVYVDPGELRWRPFVQTWLDSKFPAKISDATKVCRTEQPNECNTLFYPLPVVDLEGVLRIPWKDKLVLKKSII